ncbi:ion transporter [Candidatus Synechococcus calcipolaris G9]|uniref:Ion transporter n=1 Tax=Candidatus Synechococcus calcipolaris G9 TaxID=1497997 RepID=A0ABT6EZ17_9SYNE|nr:ion transporter [Candidatus Synechococcus calcipolaris]MDG2990440.1 ion transporter [Candidatus Synechococcus calcipolaris G9]
MAPPIKQQKESPKRSEQSLRAWLRDQEAALDIVAMVLVLFSLVIFISETYTLPEQISQTLDGINWIILVIFAAEYVLRLWLAEKWFSYMVSIYSLIDLLTLVPFFIGLVDITFIRVFRWFRILRLFRFLEGRSLLGALNVSDTIIFGRILLTLLAILFVYSGLIYQTEHIVNPQEFATFLDAFYFAVVTMTTVGFGDIAPISEVGRLLTVSMIFTGIALIPWQIGDLIKQLVKTTRQVESPCPNCGLLFHDPDAYHCKRCGTLLEN